MRKKLGLIMAIILLISFAGLSQVSAAETWTAQTSGTTVNLYDVDFVDSNIGWVVGGSGTILKTTDGGGIWAFQTSGTTAAIYAIDIVDANTGWVVGDSGTILKTTNGGTTWTALTSGTTVNLDDVDFINSSTGWAVGNGGTILKTTDGGTTWTALTSGTTVNLYDVDFVDSNTGWAVGSSGTILKTTNGGTTWTAQISGTGEHLYDVDFVDSNTGWAVGVNNAIRKTTDGGGTWAPESSGITWVILDAVDFVDSNTGWAVGYVPSAFSSPPGSGIILKITDGGSTWTSQTSLLGIGLNAVDFVDSNTGWAVGDSGTILKYGQTGAGSGVTVRGQVAGAPPELTFSIIPGIAPDGGSVTNSAIDFGTLASNTPKTGSQRLSVSTNATGGYNVTADEDHALQSGTNTISDVIGDDSTITQIVAGPWELATTYGFGYTLANSSGSDAYFTTNYKQFADKSATETEQEVMGNAGPVTNSQVNVTYKLNIGPTQPAGTYQNTVTYIATGNF